MMSDNEKLPATPIIGKVGMSRRTVYKVAKEAVRAREIVLDILSGDFSLLNNLEVSSYMLISAIFIILLNIYYVVIQLYYFGYALNDFDLKFIMIHYY